MRILYFLFIIILWLFFILLAFGGLTGNNVLKKHSDLIYRISMGIAGLIGIIYLIIMFIGLEDIV